MELSLPPHRACPLQHLRTAAEWRRWEESGLDTWQESKRGSWAEALFQSQVGTSLEAYAGACRLVLRPLDAALPSWLMTLMAERSGDCLQPSCNPACAAPPPRRACPRAPTAGGGGGAHGSGGGARGAAAAALGPFQPPPSLLRRQVGNGRRRCVCGRAAGGRASRPSGVLQAS